MKSIEQEINDFYDLWPVEKFSSFFQDIGEILELYDVDEDDDWVKNAIGKEEDASVIRLIRTAYLFSRLAENHSGTLARIKINHKDLWKRLEEYK